jgi:predicted glycosyltransferase
MLITRGIDPRQPYFVLRFVSWLASHDRGARGFSPEGKDRLIEILCEKGQIYISSEAPLPSHLMKYQPDLPVECMHHLLSFSQLFVGESASMASEAAMLGTPAVFVSKTSRGYTLEQEKEYGLVFNYSENLEEEALAKVAELIRNPDLKSEASANQKRMLADKIDVTEWMVNFFEKPMVS